MTSATGTLAVDAVIFDMDGVLVDSEPLHTRATNLLLADCGVDWDERVPAPPGRSERGGAWGPFRGPHLGQAEQAA